MNNSLPDLTPEQLRQLNAISGLQKTRRRGADASVPSALADESESAEAPDTSVSYALPKPAPNMSEEDYERQIKEGLAEHIGAIAPPTILSRRSSSTRGWISKPLLVKRSG